VSFPELREELLALFARGVAAPLPEAVFNGLALRVFRFQCRENAPYRGFVARRGTDPDAVAGWQDIPFLPTRAFKAATLVSGDPAAVQRVFRTSGTTGGREARGEHHVLDLALYQASLLPNLQAHLLPEGGPMPILCLLPSPEEAPDSSLSFMMGEAVRVFGVGGLGDPTENGSAPPVGEPQGPLGGGGFFVESNGGIQVRPFREALGSAVAGQEAVLLAGTAFAFVQWLELAGKGGWEVSLPEGSRIMETGGYKGRTRALTREDLYRGLGEAFGVPAHRIVSEYGMTELLSQFYEPNLAKGAGGGDAPAGARGGGGAGREGGGGGREGGGGAAREEGGGGQWAEAVAGRFHGGPPWVRTRILDPLTLGEMPEGEPGLLAHMDLANLGSVSGILTEDMGRRVPGGFQLVGRREGAEPRGCSLAMEDFLGPSGEGP
jgi:hypothetical protein